MVELADFLRGIEVTTSGCQARLRPMCAVDYRMEQHQNQQSRFFVSVLLISKAVCEATRKD
jgi:hypothetical protein